MKAIVLRKLDMGMRALTFSRAHPEASDAHATALAALVAALERIRRLTGEQLAGLDRVSNASARKAELRRLIVRQYLNHFAAVARHAAREVPDLVQLFPQSRVYKLPYVAFRTVAGRVLEEAGTHREVLLRHGLSAAVLDELARALERFDAAVEEWSAGRQAHVGATADLEAALREIVVAVDLLDGLNRMRFADDERMLGAWRTASSVRAAPRPEEGGEEGNDERPAA